MPKPPAQLDAEIAAALVAPRVVNKAKLEALLRHHVAVAAMWRAEALGYKEPSKYASDEDRRSEERHATEYAKQHASLAKKIQTAAVKNPGKLVELSRLEATPDELHMSDEDVWGPDES